MRTDSVHLGPSSRWDSCKDSFPTLSRTAQCTFVCNDNGKLRDAKTGWCMRPFPSHPEERHLAVLAAADPSFKDRFSCNHTSVYNRPTMSRWCCTATQPHRKQRQFMYD
ncbi:hypothetical protein VP01_1766g3 [Puccinia sorghi]|uniref:Uncharacterized protein n=1 Tax=Puccinia sorghi TaxID=27349 RepID=A0A0L6VEY4_9BASI|nr:hypothetical protein VP01_1766g3 [Puccinia sorghi]